MPARVRPKLEGTLHGSTYDANHTCVRSLVCRLGVGSPGRVLCPLAERAAVWHTMEYLPGPSCLSGLQSPAPHVSRGRGELVACISSVRSPHVLTACAYYSMHYSESASPRWRLYDSMRLGPFSSGITGFKQFRKARMLPKASTTWIGPLTAPGIESIPFSCTACRRVPARAGG